MKVTWFRKVKSILGILLIISSGSILTVGQETEEMYFNAQYYLAKYDDLCQAFDVDEEAALKHYNDYGKKEGRQASPVFNPKFYLNKYVDLREAFGSDYVKALDHWLNFGIKEGRQGSKEFNSVYYLSKNRDLVKAFGAKNYRAAIRHFMEFGISEKRRGSANFDFANSAEADRSCN